MARMTISNGSGMSVEVEIGDLVYEPLDLRPAIPTRESIDLSVPMSFTAQVVDIRFSLFDRPPARPWKLERMEGFMACCEMRYWNEPPPELSLRCLYWMERILNGWRPNRRFRSYGYHESAVQYGVWIWEWLYVLGPMLQERGLR